MMTWSFKEIVENFLNVTKILILNCGTCGIMLKRQKENQPNAYLFKLDRIDNNTLIETNSGLKGTPVVN